MIYYFMAKLLPMGDPPTCISIISHPDPSIAIRYADKALESDSQHPRVGKLREEPLRSQYAAWKNNPAVLNSNLDPNSLKELRQYIVEFKVSPINAVYVEGEHAKLHGGLRNASHHNDPSSQHPRRKPGTDNPHPLTAERKRRTEAAAPPGFLCR